MRAPGMRAPGRARRPRRAAPKGRRRGRTRPRGPPGRRPLPRTAPCRTRARGPPRTSAPTTHRTMPHTDTRAAEDVGPYHAPHHAAHMVGRDVLGAPRPRDAAEDAHGHAGRRGRRPLPRTAPCRTRPRGPPRTSAPTTHAPHHAEHMVGRDVLGAPRPRDAAEDAHGHAGRRGRRPLPRTAPCRTRPRGPPRTSAPTTHRTMPNTATRAAGTSAPTTHRTMPNTGTRAAGTSAPTTHRTMPNTW